MKVLIIGGGISAEREIALLSSRAVFEAAKSNGHECEYYDWDGSSEWLLENAQHFNAVLPILHGKGGEDGEIQSILDKAKVNYLGSAAKASQICFNKRAAFDILEQNNIMIPRGEMVSFSEYKASVLFTLPHVLKPVDSGSSVDTFIFPNLNSRDMNAIEAAFTRHPKMLLEEYITGVEITVPILEGKSLPIIEIIPPENGTFDFENKYNGATSELIPAINVSESTQQAAIKLGEKVHKLLGCRHLSRIDMIIQNEIPYVLEANTMPGMTGESLFPKAVAAAGMAFPEFVEYLLTLTRTKT